MNTQSSLPVRGNRRPRRAGRSVEHGGWGGGEHALDHVKAEGGVGRGGWEGDVKGEGGDVGGDHGRDVVLFGVDVAQDGHQHLVELLLQPRQLLAAVLCVRGAVLLRPRARTLRHEQVHLPLLPVHLLLLLAEPELLGPPLVEGEAELRVPPVLRRGRGLGGCGGGGGRGGGVQRPAELLQLLLDLLFHTAVPAVSVRDVEQVRVHLSRARQPQRAVEHDRVQDAAQHLLYLVGLHLQLLQGEHLAVHRGCGLAPPRATGSSLGALTSRAPRGKGRALTVLYSARSVTQPPPPARARTADARPTGTSTQLRGGGGVVGGGLPRTAARHQTDARRAGAAVSRVTLKE
mmetsp:Transcript_6603/g.24515  ORF Transcript_6603/g.24515 Transcript_6603/m.24515 type:complete len:346 (+) Transcript_6603:4249-5286(+)